MSEFKGTKGKWVKLITPKYKIGVLMGNRYLQLGTIYQEDCHVASCCKTEEHANALLISKAPEMLEMLKGIVIRFEDNERLSMMEISILNDAKQLIKEATEL